MKKAIIYLHGFNSASLDLSGELLTTKPKLVVLKEFCRNNKINLCSPNVDYCNFELIVSDILQLYSDLKSAGYSVLFMGSSMGGFTSEYMAMKTQSKAIMINPAISPSVLLTQFIGANENVETNQVFIWSQLHCQQYVNYEIELTQFENSRSNTMVLLDMGDELIDSAKTQKKYKDNAEVISFEGGSHGFEHMEEALSAIKKAVFADYCS